MEKKEKSEIGSAPDNANQKLAVVLKSSGGRRRYVLRNSACLLFLLGAIAAIASSFFGISMTVRKINPLDYDERVKEILTTTPLIDGHNDLPYLLRIELQNKIYDPSDFQFWNGKNMLLHLPRTMLTLLIQDWQVTQI